MNEDDVANTKPNAGTASDTTATASQKPGSRDIKVSIDVDSLKRAARSVLHFLGVHAFLLVFVTFTCAYVFLILRINTYSNPVVTETDVEGSETPLPSLQIDENAAQKLQSLNDNSVNVQTLFEESRTNPF